LWLTLLNPGGGIQATGTASALTTGTHIIIGGLFVQLFVFGFFVIVAVVFHIRIHKMPTRTSFTLPWHKHLYVLYGTSSLIMVRSVFRVIEYLQGFNGYLLRHEYYMYIFDALLMFAVMIVFNIFHPKKVQELLRDSKERWGISMDGRSGRHLRVSSDV
jgi:hypothetical protein